MGSIMDATILHHACIVLTLLWALNSFKCCHPVAYFLSLIYLYLIHEGYVMKLRKKLQFEEKRESNQSRLDKNARLLLKKLLDAVAHRTLKMHSEITAGQVATLSPSVLQKPVDTFNEQPPPMPNLVLTTSVTQSRKNGPSSDQERMLDVSDISSCKEENRLNHGSEADVVEQSSWNVGEPGSEYRMKRCRVCQRSTSKKLKSIEETKISHGEQNTNRFITGLRHQERNFDQFLKDSGQENGLTLSDKTDDSNSRKGNQIGTFVNNLSGVGSTVFSSDREVDEICDSDIEATHKPERADSLIREVSKAIEQIGLGVSALEIGADHLHLFKESFPQHQNFEPKTKSASSVLQTPYGAVPCIALDKGGESFLTGNNMLGQVTEDLSLDQPSKPVQQSTFSDLGESIQELDLPNQKVNKTRNQNAKDIMDKIESGRWTIFHNEFVPSQIHNVWKFNVAPHQSKISKRTPQRTVEYSHHGYKAMLDKDSNHGLLQPEKQSNTCPTINNNIKAIQSVDSGLKFTSNWGGPGKKHLLKIMEETQLDKKPAQLRQTSLKQQESEGTASCSYSSNWRSDQVSSHGSDSEKYPLPGKDRKLHHVIPIMTSESGTSPLSSGTSPLSDETQSQYGSFTSNAEDEVYSSTTGDIACELTSNSSSKSEGYSSYDRTIHRGLGHTYSSMESLSRKTGPTKTHKLANGVKYRERSGTWKRLKDRMAIIFHHHHHHHHHHDDDVHHGSNHRKKRRNTSLQKHKGKSYCFRREDEDYGERVIEKMRKSLIRDKNHCGHFHALVEGLLRHVWHSKELERAKKTANRSAKGKRSRNKASNSKKSHWWQLLLHQGGGKLANRTHLKLGLVKKKTRIKALPKIK